MYEGLAEECYFKNAMEIKVSSKVMLQEIIYDGAQKCSE
jgi:hypothetical protein